MAEPTRHRGKWRIRWYDQSGKRRSKSFATHSAAKKAQRRYEVAAENHALGIGPPPIEDVTFDKLCDHQLKFKTPRKRSPKDDKSMIRKHLRPFFGRMRLSDVGVATIDRFTSVKQAHGLSNKTINNALTLFGTMLRLAVDLGWLRQLPRIDKLKVGETAFHYLRTREDIQALVGAAREEAEGVFELYASALFTGMRFGELAGLHWSDVDLVRRLITVQRSYDKPTKSSKVRHVPILDPLLPILRDWRLRNPLRLVFPNQYGNMHAPSPRVTGEIFKRCLKLAGLEDMPFHSTRHTFASHWVMNGGDIFRLQRVLGHASIQMTQRYAHLAPDVYADDYGRLGDALSTSDAEVIRFEASS